MRSVVRRDLSEDGVHLDCLTWIHVNRFHNARYRRTELVLHLHSFEDEYHLLVQAATLWRVGREMSHRQLGTHDLYHAFNGKRDGYLTCGELAASRSAGGASRGRGAPLKACSGPSP